MRSGTMRAARFALENLALAFVYAGLGWIVRLPSESALFHLYASAIWPSAGVALAALLLRGPQLLPGVALGALLSNGIHLWGASSSFTAILIALIIAGGSTLQAWLGSVVARRVAGKDVALDTPRGVGLFILLCGPVVSLTAATIGSCALYLGGQRPLPSTLVEWLSWWAGDSIGVLLFTPIVLALWGRRHPVWKQRLWLVALPLFFAGVVGSGIFAAIGVLEHDNLQEEFGREAVLLANAVRTDFIRAEEDSPILADLFRATDNVSRENFNALAAGLHRRHSYVQALEWIPRVPHAELVAHEAKVRAQGVANYAVTERAADGGHVPVAFRTEYFPVYFVYPLRGNEAALGYDLGSEKQRAAALDEARRTNRLAVTSRVRLVQETETQSGVLAFQPVYERGASPGDPASLMGFALTVIRVGTLMENALRDLPAVDLHYRLEDLDAPAQARDLYAGTALGERAVYTYASTYRFGGHRLRFSVEAGENFRFAHRAWYTWAMLVLGTGAASVLVAFLLLWSGRTARTEQLVSERTAELESARTAAVKSSQLLEEAVNSIALGFTIHDENDRLVICNEAYRQFYEASRDLIVPGNTFEQIVREGAARGQYPAAVGHLDHWVRERVTRHRDPDGVPIEQPLLDGRWLMIVEHKTPSGYIVGNRLDITPLKRATAELVTRNAQLDAIFQSSPDGVVLVDQSGVVQSANPAFCRLTGMVATDIVGHPLSELEAGLRARADDATEWEGLAQCFAPGEQAANGRQLLHLRRPRAAVLELFGATGETAEAGKLLYVHDVTHEVEVDRMKSEFLSHAAHELRTPLASIYGFSELLITTEFDEATRRELLQTIHKQSEWLVDIINELLDLARIESRRGLDFNVEDVALPPLVAEAVETIGADRARWPITVEPREGLPPVRADLAKLRQALTNVVGNAVTYSPQGGGIAISYALRGDGPERKVGIVVTDRGIGMSPDQVARVGERFYRADTSGNVPGSGLGMAIVKEILDLLGGGYEITSTPGAGTTVTLWVPAATARAKPDPALEAIAA